MPKYTYIDKQGNKQNITAPDANTAIATAPNRDLNSGVQEIKDAAENVDLGRMESDDADGFNFKESGLGDFSISREEDNALEKLISQSREGSVGEVDEGKIRNRNLSLFQDQIDAVNQIYDSLVSDEKVAGLDREGQGRAIRNRQGLVGSGRGETQRQNIVAKNQEVIQSIQAERSYKIGAILGEANRQSIAEIQAERDAKRQSASDYLKYLGVQDERREKNVKASIASLIAQGFTLDDLSPDEFKELQQSLRISGDMLRSTYEEMKPEAEEGKDPEFFNLSEGQSRYIYDPETGEVKLVASKSKTYAPKAGSGSGSGDDDSDGGGTDTGGGGSTNEVEVMTFDEFKETDAAKQIIEEEQNRLQQSFTPALRDQILKQVYDKEIESLEKSTGTKASSASGDTSPSLKNLTASKKSSLEQAGLLGASGNAQTYYLNTPTAFQQYYSRERASGQISGASLNDIDAAYAKWYEQEKGGSSGGSSSGGGDDDVFNF